jgi:type IV pilus assembly protein PilE
MRKQKGFHLFEILIVLCIIGILAAFSTPLYSNYIVKAHRLEAEISLKKLAAALEQFYTEHDTYSGATLQNLGFESIIAKNSYQLKILNMNHSGYTLEAIPLGVQAEKDILCGRLTLDSLGEMKIEGTGQVTDCL